MQPTQPSDTGDDLSSYIPELRGSPMLSAEAERALCYRWRDHHYISAVRQLAVSHLRLVVKAARKYRAYGLPTEDLIGEGHVGLMRAVCRFDPNRGVRFATYAIWWIRAATQTYILRNWSLVKMGTTASQKKLFFNLRRVRGHLLPGEYGPLHSEDVSTIADMLQVPEHDVITMDQRLASPDHSLNTPVGPDGESEWQTCLPDDSDDQEADLAEAEETTRRKSLLQSALRDLTGREHHNRTRAAAERDGRHLTVVIATLRPLQRADSADRGAGLGQATTLGSGIARAEGRL